MLSGKTLKKSRRMAILLIFIASAVITPTPDPFTMFLLAGPLCAVLHRAGDLPGHRQATRRVGRRARLVGPVRRRGLTSQLGSGP
nr:twin-arginine translocase subunit TatC [Janibacter limosus]